MFADNERVVRDVQLHSNGARTSGPAEGGSGRRRRNLRGWHLPLTKVWPSGWSWGHGASHYLAMIIGLYATLGVFLLLATRDPLANRSLIWFTVVSSVVHAVIMAVQALTDSNERGHLLGDVPALLIIAAVLAVLLQRADTPRAAGADSR